MFAAWVVPNTHSTYCVAVIRRVWSRVFSTFKWIILTGSSGLAKSVRHLTEAVRVVFEDGVTCAMRDPVRLVCTGGEGRGGPYFAGFFIPQVKRFTGWIADRVVGPGREAVFTAVYCPGALAAGFADHKTKLRITNHIDPRGRGGPAWAVSSMTYSRPSALKPP